MPRFIVAAIGQKGGTPVANPTSFNDSGLLIADLLNS